MNGGAADPAHLALRRGVLATLGATSTTVDELLAYGANPLLAIGRPALPELPLGDEPLLEAWRDYAADARSRGAWSALRERLVQLRFPIRAGISREEAYRAAARRGVVESGGDGLLLDQPEALELELHPSLGGTVPVLVPGCRSDFVTLTRALSGRNEPIPVPASMGACLVAGLVNWDRVASHRRRWEEGAPGRREDPTAWAAELSALTARKELYQDRLLLLSRGPYSNVAAAELQVAEAEWLAASLAIRREHECAHYFTLRLFGRLQHNLLEELVADLVGLVRGVGRYRADWAARFLGLESYPAYREGARLEIYRGTPPLSDGAFTVLTRLAEAGISTLDRLGGRHPEWRNEAPALAQAVAALSTLTIEELASGDGVERVEERTRMLFD